MTHPTDQNLATAPHKEAEVLRLREALTRSDALLGSVMDSSGDCMKILDRDGRLMVMNEPGQRLLGIRDIRPFLNTCWVDWWNADDHAKAEAAVASAAQGRAGRFVAFARTPGGEDKWWDVVVTAFRGLGDEVEGYLSVSRDITELKAAEESLRESRDAAEAANRAKDRFLAVLSHELRTPLSPVLSMAQLMERDALVPEPSREAFGLIRRNAELQARLIDDLLDITRISSGKLELSPAVVNVHERLGEVMAILRDDAAHAGLTLTLEPGAADHHVQGDPTRLAQVFWNLLKNAIKFTPAGGRVALATRNVGTANVEVVVSDDGMGIDPAMLPKLFDAFEQGGRDVTRLFGGLGLGLSITKALVDLHGGTIGVRSGGKGQGAEFTVTLPTTASARAADREADRPRAARECRILLVEDHVDTARVIGRLLAANGHAVHTAHTMSSALELAAVERFDLVISDLGLPDGSGLDLMRRLLERSPIKGIALTGYGMEDDIRSTRSAGFTEHMVKPVDAAQLEAAIRRVAVCPEGR